MCDKSKTILDYTIEFLDKYIPEWFETGNKCPLFIFFSGPQGSGKSFTSIQIYNHLMEKYGGEKSIGYASIDDFYLTHEDQLKLNEQFKSNKLLQGRGLPGTHDMKLLQEVLNTIFNNNEHPDQDTVVLPKYDKSQFKGEGDRCPTGQKIKLPVDIFILEGWFLGFNPILQGIENNDLLTGDMVDVNAKLFFYSDLLWRNPEIKSLGIVFTTDDINNVYGWRLQQEHELISKVGKGMTDEQVHAFVDRCMSSYKLYLNDFVRSESLGSIATLTLGIDSNRNVYSTKTRCIE
ncbi:CEI_1a_G0021680.mRNA.1.CDS.1 [Saccharomyces cerevisiae]|nr:EM14S01-3B_G0034740.mRNA.1.CDS.1 [Saccharomyces cerevisiae]CAI4494564.1 AMH_1a_G0021760.mRNA.1.CDS.1 [Saccharomyces cerevisiae]CAI4503979.1 CEI_1a_G0021680.mRNA.1.CDS.1 [Saccharomyces cerevisiae]CAI6687297.1 AMH_1a_G0021760.mRNA.1.CDS.1 [Saccharomyces cerevisiae]CAI7313042.1 CEI_1a_G0021680.mRNA.1.CDS.1 [Saccharomyces cerevisiae]